MQNQIKTLLLMGCLTALFVGFGRLFGPSHMWLFVGISLISNLVMYFFSDKMVLMMHGAQKVDRQQAPMFYRITEELVRRAELPMPSLYVIPMEQPNAFATGRNPKHAAVAVTSGIMNLLSERELRGVIAHELAHIKNRDILISTIAAMMAAAIAQLGNMVKWSAILGRRDSDNDNGSGWAQLAMAFVAPIAAVLLQLGVSRAREYHADQVGASICDDPQALASALQRLERGAQLQTADVNPVTANLFIVNPFAGIERGALLELLSTHPKTAERVRRLMEMAQGMTPY